MTTRRCHRWLLHLVSLGMGLAAALLPWRGIGNTPWQLVGVAPVDCALLATAPAAVALLWLRRRRLLREPALLLLTGLALLVVLAGLRALRAGTTTHAGLAGALLMPVVVAGLAALPRRTAARGRVTSAFVVGGTVAVAVSLLGYGAMVVRGDLVDGVSPFLFQSTHPLFAGLPRLSGTFGHSPQQQGEYLLALVAVALTWQPVTSRGWRTRRLALGLAAVAAVLTLSFALVGFVPLLVVAAHRRRWPRRMIWGLCGVGLGVVVAALWAMSVGWSRADLPAPGVVDVPCAQLDTWHQVHRPAAAGSVSCRAIVVDTPYRSLLTMPRHAHASALAIALEHPWLGVGTNGYAALVRQRLREPFGTDQVACYYTPHQLWLGAWATGGLGALLCALGLTVALLRSAWAAIRQGRDVWLWAAVLGFLLLGLQLDELATRSCWFVLGLAMAGRRPVLH